MVFAWPECVVLVGHRFQSPYGFSWISVFFSPSVQAAERDAVSRSVPRHPSPSAAINLRLSLLPRVSVADYCNVTRIPPPSMHGPSPLFLCLISLPATPSDPANPGLHAPSPSTHSASGKRCQNDRPASPRSIYALHTRYDSILCEVMMANIRTLQAWSRDARSV